MEKTTNTPPIGGLFNGLDSEALSVFGWIVGQQRRKAVVYRADLDRWATKKGLKKRLDRCMKALESRGLIMCDGETIEDP